jgi:hypothetical protein
MADNRFFPRFKLEFARLPAPAGPGAGGLAAVASSAASAASAITSLVPISRDFYEADVKVTMRYALVPGSFEVTIAGLSALLYDAIEPKKTSVKITLGYYHGDGTQVFEGVVQKKEAKAGECFYETTLSGIEKAYHLLERKCFRQSDVGDATNRDLLDILRDVADQAGVPLQVEGVSSGPATSVARNWSFHEKSALDVLRDVHYRVRAIEGYSLALRDGKIWYARKQGERNNTGLEVPGEISHANYLAKSDKVQDDQGGRRSPCQPASEEPAPIGYDFVMLGDPRLRPGDTATFRIKDKDREVTERLTVESVTHDFSRANGYRCTGRALLAATFLKTAFRAMAPGAGAVGEEVNSMLARNQERFPAVHVGDVTGYTTPGHFADARLGLQFQPTMTSPSVQVRVGAEGFQLEHRPIVTPFAWNHCGLVVPVYPGMRAVALHNRYLREDALLSGFIWTEEMTPPPSQVGDHWLCLPAGAPGNRPPSTSDKAANDLTAADGKRVIQLKGLRITIGDGLLENLGTRPANLGADDELQVEHSSGAKLTIKNDEITLQAGQRTLTLANGKVSIT